MKMGLTIPSVKLPNVYTAGNRYASADSTEKLTKAFDLDGTDEHLVAGSNIGAFTENDPWSFACWVKPGSITGDHALIYGNTLDGWGARIRSTGNIRFVIISDGSHLFQQDTSTTLSAGTLYHVACTYDGSNTEAGLKTYINGSLDEGVSQTGGSGGPSGIDTTRATTIGRFADGSAYLDGLIAGIGVWDIELSAAEVAELYDATPADAIRPKEHSRAASLVAAYDGMETGDDMTGTSGTIQDSSATGNDLTPTNTEAGDLVAFP